MNVLNAQGNLVTSGVIRPGTEPGDSTQLAIDPALGFYAPATDTYFIKLATTATDQSYNRGYDLHLERIGRTEDGYLAALDQGGSFHVWRNQNGNLLNV